MLNQTPSPQRTKEFVISVTELTHAYKERNGLTQVSFSLEKGASLCLLGPNGSGKTTLLRILSTVQKPTTGNVQILGFDLSSQSNEIRKRISTVFQSPGLDGKLTAKENLICQGKLYAIPSSHLLEKIPQVLTQFGLQDRENEKVEGFSGGMKRRLDLARALLHDPELLILDEPTTGLDPIAKREFWKLVFERKQKTNLTLLVATHMTDEAEFCQKTILLDQGKIILAGETAQLKQELGRDLVTIRSHQVDKIQEKLEKTFSLSIQKLEGEIRFAKPKIPNWVEEFFTLFPNELDSLTIGKPTLEDLFIAKTGKRLNLTQALP